MKVKILKNCSVYFDCRTLAKFKKDEIVSLSETQTKDLLKYKCAKIWEEPKKKSEAKKENKMFKPKEDKKI
jgi:hypothetical protein